MGQVPGIAVDRRDHVFVLHRPRTVPEADRHRAAPAVIEFDEKGAFVKAWGGPGNGYDWPDSEHGIFVDHKDNVWVGGSSPTSQSLTTSVWPLSVWMSSSPSLLQTRSRPSAEAETKRSPSAVQLQA